MPNRLSEPSKKKNVSPIIYFKKINLYLLIVKPINYIYINLINIDLLIFFNFQPNFITGYIKL